MREKWLKRKMMLRLLRRAPAIGALTPLDGIRWIKWIKMDENAEKWMKGSL